MIKIKDTPFIRDLNNFAVINNNNKCSFKNQQEKDIENRINKLEKHIQNTEIYLQQILQRLNK